MDKPLASDRHTGRPRIRCRYRTPAWPAAFTVIELLAVIAIIALLMAIIFPVLSTAREYGQSVQCLSKLHGIGLTVENYAHDFNELYPRALPVAPGADPSVREDWQIP